MEAQITFDSYPDNKELWEIINKEKKVENLQLRLQVHGKSGNYTIQCKISRMVMCCYDIIVISYVAENM